MIESFFGSLAFYGLIVLSAQVTGFFNRILGR